jgi:hypothetical protein
MILLQRHFISFSVLTLIGNGFLFVHTLAASVGVSSSGPSANRGDRTTMPGAIYSSNDPSDWGGGWDWASKETAMLFHPSEAYFDLRTRNFSASTSTSSEDNKQGSNPTTPKLVRGPYVRILISAQPEHLPSFFDHWDNKFMEKMRNLKCRLHYMFHSPSASAGSRAGGGGDGATSTSTSTSTSGSSVKKSSSPVGTVIVKDLESPVVAVYPSPFDWSWYPAPFSAPYIAYCALPPPRGNTSSASIALPFAVTLFTPEEKETRAFAKAQHFIAGTMLRTILRDNLPRRLCS